MHNRLATDLVDLHEIVARQKALGRRLLWLVLLPFVITAALVPMFFVLNARVTDVEVVTKQLNIERYLLMDTNYALAIEQYEQLARSNLTAPVLARLGVLYFQFDHKNKDIAIKTLEAAKRLDPNYSEIYRNLTFIYTVAGNYKDAIEAGQKALELYKNDAMTLNNLAWVYSRPNNVELRNLDLAQQYAEAALNLTGAGEKKSEVLDTLASVHSQKGGPRDRELAVEYLHKAVALAPNWEIQIYQEHLKKVLMTNPDTNGGTQ
jgi:tetratricopeptide (TPR) repeat protein